METLNKTHLKTACRIPIEFPIISERDYYNVILILNNKIEGNWLCFNWTAAIAKYVDVIQEYGKDLKDMVTTNNVSAVEIKNGRIELNKPIVK